MGLPMARNLLQAGHKLAVYNRTSARADVLRPLGATVGDSAAAAARGADVLVSMVADDAALEDLMLGEDGAIAALPRGAIHVSMSTISPSLSQWLAERHGAVGQLYVAAPVFGRPEAAEAKKLWIVAAGPAPAIERCHPLFDAIAQGVITVGDDPARANVIKLAGKAADAVAAPLPLASLVRDRYLSAVARGWSEVDWSALARVAAADAGL